MPAEEGRLVDDGVAEPASREDLARAFASPAGIEIVAMEIEHHDPRALYLLEQRIKLGRVEFPAVIEIVEAAIGRRGGGNDRVDLGGGVRGHQRQERAERLPGED